LPSKISPLHYIEVSLELTDHIFAEILEAELAEIDFESFDLKGNKLNAYIQEPLFNQLALETICSEYEENITSLQKQRIEHTNWNAVWESSYEPVLLNKELFIGAHFHEIPVDVKHIILLEPNMSFGTGHHPTTEQILRFMFTMDLTNKSILDFGCGSAILSIYASQRGAHGVGIEIDPHAADTARENLKMNNISNFTIHTGNIEALNENKFDVIVANINRNVIEESLGRFFNALNAGGWLLCSGFLTLDPQPLADRIMEAGYQIEKITNQNDWVMIAAKKIA
jgi:ribosomal protein L11 methyltransferase